MDTYGSVLQHQGKPEQAEAILRECFRLREKVLGPTNEGTVTTLGNLAFVYLDNGRWAEAEEACRKTIERRGTSQGRMGVESFAAYSNLGVSLFGLGRLDEAEKLLKELQETCSNTCGPTHLNTLNIQHILARVLAGEKRWAEAEELARNTLKIRREVTPGQEGTGRTMLYLGRILVETKSLDDAESLLSEALSLFKERYPKKTALAAEAQNWLGTVQLRRGNLAAAEPLLIASGEPLLIARGISEAERRDLIGHLVELYEVSGKTAARDEWSKRLEEASAARKR
jgi:tetratricopeptide (TPR) repeat protein